MKYLIFREFLKSFPYDLYYEFVEVFEGTDKQVNSKCNKLDCMINGYIVTCEYSKDLDYLDYLKQEGFKVKSSLLEKYGITKDQLETLIKELKELNEQVHCKSFHL